MYERAGGVVGEEKVLLKFEKAIGPTDWSRTGYIPFNEELPPYDLWALPLFRDRKPLCVTETPFNEVGARISPDGHWIAYLSNESPGPRYQLRAIVSAAGHETAAVQGWRVHPTMESGRPRAVLRVTGPHLDGRFDQIHRIFTGGWRSDASLQSAHRQSIARKRPKL